MLIRLWPLKSIFLLALLSGSAFASEPFGNIPNGADLHTDKFFSRPLTVLEYVIANVAEQAKQVARLTESPTKNYSLDKSWPSDPNKGQAGYDVLTGRTIIYLEMHVEYMSDPWRETCLGRLKHFSGWFFFPAKNVDDRIKLSLMVPYYAHITETDPKNATASIDRFLDSIIFRASFYVGDTREGKLKFTRSCQLDNATGEFAYDEYLHPDK